MGKRTAKKIGKFCQNMAEFLIEKNKKYGDAALKPLNVFSKLEAEDQILNRIDDKISRIKNSKELRKNDIIDLIGYLVLLCIKKGWIDLKDLQD